MPIFKYECDNCGETTVAMHLSSEELLDCNICEEKNVLVRLLNKPFLKKEALIRIPLRQGKSLRNILKKIEKF